jgi:hypothetical protein
MAVVACWAWVSAAAKIAKTSRKIAFRIRGRLRSAVPRFNFDSMFTGTRLSRVLT